ncbi:helix-turn-helix domain-containing protein [Faecalibacillus intestinalis]|uniref:helix-turn-helix domain-containing protein n=1 Tax=Faecalibacillus intestinalis TaxID=1982626 RepID=UPI003FEEB959
MQKNRWYIFKRYINKRKVEEAKFLIQCTNVSLLEISTTLSFADQSHFSKVFKKYTDISPNQYKNKLKK